MKIGIASQNLKTITAHAGKTRKFIVYDSSPDGSWAEDYTIKLPKEMSMHEFTGTEHPLDELDVLIVGGCGPGFIRKMQRRGVEVIATSETSPVNAIKTYVAGQPLPAAAPHEH